MTTPSSYPEEGETKTGCAPFLEEMKRSEDASASVAEAVTGCPCGLPMINDNWCSGGHHRDTTAAHWEIAVLIGPCDETDAQWLTELVFDAVQGRLGAVVSRSRIDDLAAWSTPRSVAE